MQINGSVIEKGKVERKDRKWMVCNAKNEHPKSK